MIVFEVLQTKPLKRHGYPSPLQPTTLSPQGVYCTPLRTGTEDNPWAREGGGGLPSRFLSCLQSKGGRESYDNFFIKGFFIFPLIVPGSKNPPFWLFFRFHVFLLSPWEIAPWEIASFLNLFDFFGSCLSTGRGKL